MFVNIKRNGYGILISSQAFLACLTILCYASLKEWNRSEGGEGQEVLCKQMHQ